MACILGTLFLGITFLSVNVGAVPSESETVISQLARTAYGNRNLLYLLTISATTIILIMAANTAYADFPRLSALMASDGFLPRQLTFRGSRLVYSRGIILLALVASLLIILFNASVTLLIPLYAIGVFLSFTLSQSGMAHRWWKSGQLKPGEQRQEAGSILEFDPRWTLKMGINSFGAVCTAFVMIVFAVTKFADGAWIVLVLTPTLAITFYIVRRHYKNLAKNLSLEEYMEPRRVTRHRVVLPVSGVHRGTLEALNYARSLSSDVTAVHVSIDPEESQKLQQKWEIWGDNTRLVLVESPYRLLLEPLLEYIEMLSDTRQPGEVITVVVPQFVPEKGWANVLHTQTALWLRFALLSTPGIVITEVPYQVK
jgi:hypothetical protein